MHFHKVGFQLIFCYRGWVEVLYEDQGGPIRLQAGDCFVQPPEIRHRVMEASDGIEVIEIGIPADHVTEIEHKQVGEAIAADLLEDVSHNTLIPGRARAHLRTPQDGDEPTSQRSASYAVSLPMGMAGLSSGSIIITGADGIGRYAGQIFQPFYLTDETCCCVRLRLVKVL